MSTSLAISINQKGYRFYSPHSHTRILKTNQATFIDEMNISKYADEGNLEPDVIASSGIDSYERLAYNDDEEIYDSMAENNEILAENNVNVLHPPVNFAQEDII